MCGIAGIVSQPHRVERKRLGTMLERLAHRGPDDRGMHTADGVGFVQTRLSIIGLHNGHQPICTDDGAMCLIANCEIYNHVELRLDLERAGYHFRTDTDAETILHAYRHYGRESFLKHLNGMFAFALHDRVRGEVLLARDRFGIKPLYLSVEDDGVCFASEIKALLDARNTAPEVSPRALAGFLQANFTTGTETLVAGIERVMPGEAISVRDGRVRRRWRYWSVRETESRPWRYADAVPHFEALVDTVVREHLRSDVPVGLFLSGGMDSSLLLAVMARLGEMPAVAFSASMGDGAASETEVARRTAERFGVEHRVLELDAVALLERLPLAVWSADDLTADYANLPTLALAEAASESLKVVLTGEGGDEVFAGYGRYRVRGPKRWRDRYRAPDTAGFRAQGVLAPAWVDKCFGPALREHRDAWRAPLVQAWSSAPASWSDLQRMQGADIETWLPEDLLVKADRMLMTHGVEGRVPFLDHRIVEFGLSLPDRMKCGFRTGKRFLRRYAREMLPAEVCGGAKRGFTVPVKSWLAGARLDRLEPILVSHPFVREWLLPEGVSALCREQACGGRVSPGLWAILNAALWHDFFVEGFGERPADRVDPLELMAAR